MEFSHKETTMLHMHVHTCTELGAMGGLQSEERRYVDLHIVRMQYA